MELQEEHTLKLDPELESVKLYKNSKGYNWEIKIIGIDLVKLKKINDEMIREYDQTTI